MRVHWFELDDKGSRKGTGLSWMERKDVLG